MLLNKILRDIRVMRVTSLGRTKKMITLSTMEKPRDLNKMITMEHTFMIVEEMKAKKRISLVQASPCLPMRNMRDQKKELLTLKLMTPLRMNLRMALEAANKLESLPTSSLITMET